MQQTTSCLLSFRPKVSNLRPQGPLSCVFYLFPCSNPFNSVDELSLFQPSRTKIGLILFLVLLCFYNLLLIKAIFYFIQRDCLHHHSCLSQLYHFYLSKPFYRCFIKFFLHESTSFCPQISD